MALPVAWFRVVDLSIPVFDMPDRRTPDNRVVRWVFLRDLEAALYGNNTSTGALHRLMARESLCVCDPPLRRHSFGARC
jgi:hypothetical protein